MEIKIKKLNHLQVCIPPGQEESARNFYKNILGLEEIEKPETLKPNGGMWFILADIQLHIGIEEAQGYSKRHFALEVENIMAIRKYLSDNNIKLQEEKKIPGQERFSCFDPFNNRIEFLELI